MADMEQVIEDSVNDANLDDTDVDTGSDEVTSPAADAAADDAASVEAAGAEEATTEVVAPAVKDNVDKPIEGAAKPAEDEFAKKFGISATGVTGRENRIPYSRVKKIVEKNERDVVARVTKELEDKYNPQINETGAKVQDYESRLGRVAQFEQVMTTNPREFLGMLSGLPAYKEFFEFVNKAMEGQGGRIEDAKTTPTAAAGDAMPEPDKLLADGSRVYSMDGLKALMAWQGQQVETRVNAGWEKKVNERFGPIEQAYKSQEYMAKLVPQIDAQIAEARKLPNFAELEDDVVKILNENPRINLEGAYVQAYQTKIVPKLSTDRNKLRSEILAEIKKQPAVTAAPAGVARTKPTPGAVRSTEDVIKASLEEAGLTGR